MEVDFDKTDIYHPSIELMEFIENQYKNNSIKIFNIFQHVNELNKIFHNRNKFFLDKLDIRLVDIIGMCTTTDDGVRGIEEYLKRAFEYYFKLYHIELNMDVISIFDLEDILQSLLSIQSVDSSTAAQLLPTIENDTINNEERFSTLISEYSIHPESFIYDTINKIGDEWFISMSKYFNSIIYRGNKDVCEATMLKLQPLIDIDSRFMSTTIVKEILYYGYTPFNFDSYLINLYKNINHHGEDIDSIVFELIATNYISTDKPLINSEALLNTINFKLLDNITYKEALSKIIKPFEDTLLKIKG